jgi:rhamnogalacturonyl hydrolase YesR
MVITRRLCPIMWSINDIICYPNPCCSLLINCVIMFVTWHFSWKIWRCCLVLNTITQFGDQSSNSQYPSVTHPWYLINLCYHVHHMTFCHLENWRCLLILYENMENIKASKNCICWKKFNENISRGNRNFLTHSSHKMEIF